MRGENVKSRTEMSPAELTQAWSKASEQMMEELPPEVEALLADLLFDGERVIFKIRSHGIVERNQLALTNRRLFIFIKGLSGGQGQKSKNLIAAIADIGRLSVRIYPLSKLTGFEFSPQRGTGYLQVLTDMTSEDDKEGKFMFGTNLGYFKGILVYHKILELQENDGA